MSTVEIYTIGGNIIRQDGNVSVDEASGILKVHDASYRVTTRFERGGWIGYVIKDTADVAPSLAPPVVPAPPPSKDDDIPF